MSSQAVASGLTSEQFKQSVLRKCRESAEMKELLPDERGSSGAGLRQTRAGSAGGHRLFVMGNGGQLLRRHARGREFVHPIIEKRRAFPRHP